MLEMFSWQELGPHDIVMVLRTVVLYIVSLVVIRLMGKRSVGQLSPFDFMVLIIIGSAIAIPMEDEEIPLVHGVIPILTILIINYFLYWMIRKNRPVEDFLQGTSTILVRDGKVLLENLKKERITLADLLIILREKEVKRIEEVKEAVIEPNGLVSILRDSGQKLKRPSPQNILGIKTIKDTYKVDLNLILDAIALGLNDEEIASIAGQTADTIAELRKRLGSLHSEIGLSVSQKRYYMDNSS